MTGALALDRYAGRLIRHAEQAGNAPRSRHVSETLTSQQFAVLNALRGRALPQGYGLPGPASMDGEVEIGVAKDFPLGRWVHQQRKALRAEGEGEAAQDPRRRRRSPSSASSCRPTRASTTSTTRRRIAAGSKRA